MLGSDHIKYHEARKMLDREAGVLGHPRPHAAQQQGGRCHGGLGGGRQQGEDQGGRGVEEFGGGCLHPVEGEGQGGQQGSGQGSQTIRWD